MTWHSCCNHQNIDQYCQNYEQIQNKSQNFRANYSYSNIYTYIIWYMDNNIYEVFLFVFKFRHLHYQKRKFFSLNLSHLFYQKRNFVNVKTITLPCFYKLYNLDNTFIIGRLHIFSHITPLAHCFLLYYRHKIVE